MNASCNTPIGSCGGIWIVFSDIPLDVAAFLLSYYPPTFGLVVQ